MEPASSLGLLGLLSAVSLQALASAAEAALTAISHRQAHAQLDGGAPRSKVLLSLLSQPYRLRGTTLILSTFATVAAAALTLSLVAAWGASERIGALVGLVLALLLVGTALPKAIATSKPHIVALLLARPLLVAAWLCAPLLLLLRFLVRPGQSTNGDPLVSEDDLQMLINVGQEDGSIAKEEREMIRGIIELGDTIVREVMVPRVDVVAVPLNATVSQAARQLLTSRHSRSPVYDGHLDHVVGLINLRDLIGPLLAGRGNDQIQLLLREPLFVPETMKVDDLLRVMQQQRTRLALIVDEYGGFAGLATVEDLVEEIVGELQDEYDREEAMVEALGEGVWRFNGRISIYEVSELTGLELESEEVDSLGGYVSELLGSIPREGDRVSIPSARITVESINGLRPHTLLLELQPQPAELAQLREEPG